MVSAAFAYGASLVNSRPMLVAGHAVITCNDDSNDGDNGNGKGKVVELMKQNFTEAVVKIK